MGFNTKVVWFWMIWGTPILGNPHLAKGDKMWTFDWLRTCFEWFVGDPMTNLHNV
jgi:hypothetical protein